MELIGAWPICCGLRQLQHLEELRELQSQVWILGYFGTIWRVCAGCLFWFVWILLWAFDDYWWLYSEKFIASGDNLWANMLLCSKPKALGRDVFPFHLTIKEWLQDTLGVKSQIDRVLFVLLFAFPEMWDRWNFISAPSKAISVVCTNIKE